MLLGPDGKSLYVAARQPHQVDGSGRSYVPRIWGEDFLVPRLWDAIRPSPSASWRPAGCIYKTDKDGKNWKLISMGYRNEYDAAFNRDGELFTYDADMEWDMNLPWYRPTRVCHAVPGSEFGWRGGTGKMYEYHPDNLPPVVNVGPGSPTGITFGYGAKFPAKYQEALYLCDWSLRQALRLPSHAQRRVLHRRTGRVLDRLAVAAHRHRHQSQGRRHVLHHRRPQHHVGPVSRHLRRPGIDETLQRETCSTVPAAVTMARPPKLESLYGKKDPGPSTRPGRS